ncbi:MAG: hypothetical protein ABI551_19275 [Polyangiaceae bacterium]
MPPSWALAWLPKGAPASAGTWLGSWLTKSLEMPFAHFKTVARFIEAHTGIPALLVAALLVVLGWRMAKRMAHVAVEVAVVALLLLALTKLGVVSW